MSPATASLRALGTTALVAVTVPEMVQIARRVLISELRAFDLACSRFRTDSELAAVNRFAGTAVAVSTRLRDAVRCALHAAELTSGLVDPTVGRAMRLAGYDRTFVRIELRDGRLVRPSFERAGRWGEIELDDDLGTVRIPVGVELDLGATAKALVADRVATVAALETGAGVLVSIGGDIAVAGIAPDAGWTVGVADDHAESPEAVGCRVALASGGLASSGTRVRRWRTDAGELHHILDPRTGRPAAGPWVTASVAAASCVDANTASTAAIVLGDVAPSWLEERRLPARLARANGEVIVVGGWPAEQAAA
jgi:thiamine biosynthesis lipoprotein